MTAFDYSRPRATAERLINRFGQAATLKQRSVGSGHTPTVTKNEYACKLAVLNFKETDIDGTKILEGDKLAYLSTEGLTVTPTKDDILTIGGEDHEIADLMPLSPAGTVIFWKAQVRV